MFKSIKSLVFVLIGIFLLTTISANGLSITSNKNFDFNLTEGTTFQINFTIKNEEAFTFQNITFETNDVVSFPQITLTSGESKDVIAIVDADEDFSGTIKIKGFYQAQLGQQNELHQLDVDYDSRTVSQCDFAVIKGDNVEWKNLLTIPTGQIKMKNSITGEDVTTIEPDLTFQRGFPNPETFSYFFTRFGIPFTDTCTITSLDTSGFINNPDFDTDIILSVGIIFKPTTVSLNVLTSIYSLKATDSLQDILKVTNTGNEEARDVFLFAEWFSFSPNVFDLSPGESKNIGYTILPVIQNTSDTNQTYIKKVIVSGNFPELSSNFDIFIEFTEITGTPGSSSQTLGAIIEEKLEFAEAYCKENPDERICDFIDKSVTIQGASDNEGGFNSEFASALIEFIDRRDAEEKLAREQLAKSDEKLNQFLNDSNATKIAVAELKKDFQDSEDQTDLILIGLFLVLGGTLFGSLIYVEIKKKKEREFNG